MIKKSLFSIIIPVYNVERYLGECLDSIICQSYRDYEVLMIDDGSKDSSGTICDEYVAKDSRFHVIHKVNGGVSSARNEGLIKAKGEWVVFIDGDDKIESDYLEYIWDNADEYVDLIHIGYSTINSDGRGLNGISYVKSTYSADSLPEAIPSLLKICAPWGKAFRRSVITENGLLFDDGLCLSEDRLFLFRFLIHVRGIRFLDYVGYKYRQLPNSLMTKTHPLHIQEYRLKRLYAAAFAIKDAWNLTFDQFLPFWLCHLVYVQNTMDLKNKKEKGYYRDLLSGYFYNYSRQLSFADSIRLFHNVGSYNYLLSTYHYYGAQIVRCLHTHKDKIKKTIKKLTGK